MIHREWYTHGQIVRRHDLNESGEPIRRLFYAGNRLARREFHDRSGSHVSTEHFDADGFITESIRFSGSRETDHWWYRRAVPVKCIRGGATYQRAGQLWKRTAER